MIETKITFRTTAPWGKRGKFVEKKGGKKKWLRNHRARRLKRKGELLKKCLGTFGVREIP